MIISYGKNTLAESLVLFNEELEQEIFEHVCVNVLNLTAEYLEKDPLNGDIYKNPLMVVAWESWKYRAQVAIALHKESHSK